MEPKSQKIGLDNPVFRGRLRNPLADRPVELYVARNTKGYVSRGAHTAPAEPKQVEVAAQQELEDTRRRHITARRAARAAIRATKRHTPDARSSFVQKISAFQASVPVKQYIARLNAHRKQMRIMQPKFVLQTMAVVVFIIGLSVSLRTEHTNRQATAEVSALSQQAEGDSSDDADSRNANNNNVPITKKPSKKAVNSYVVAPDLPRYISISKMKVKARVLQVGVKTDGSLDTPRNVYDTGWYTGSAKPGQPGATVIDGHVSSWKTKGVFHGLKNLRKGDIVTITRGDGTILNYRVKHQQTYKAESVDMQKVIRPITSGKSGLNLITCAGKVKPGTNDFTHRVVVFAEQM